MPIIREQRIKRKMYPARGEPGYETRTVSPSYTAVFYRHTPGYIRMYAPTNVIGDSYISRGDVCPDSDGNIEWSLTPFPPAYIED